MPGHDFILNFVEPLNKLGIDYMVTGAVAAIFYGEPRLTHDIDIVFPQERSRKPRRRQTPRPAHRAVA